MKAVLIANEEESPVPEIGLDYVVAQGAMDDLRDGPIYWLDSADFGPTVGTGGMCPWELSVEGVMGHSGMTHNCVNALEVGMAVALELRRWFMETYPPHADEERWGFLTPSTLKSTVIDVANDKVTKIPGRAIIRGDIRLTPFYEMEAAIEGAIAFVERFNQRIESGQLPAGFPRVVTVSGERARVKLERTGRYLEGIACHLDSRGLEALEQAMVAVRGSGGCKRFSMTGSLPLVRDLQRRGFDVQITGFGRSTYYHAPNEQAHLQHFRDGFAILWQLLQRL